MEVATCSPYGYTGGIPRKQVKFSDVSENSVKISQQGAEIRKELKNEIKIVNEDFCEKLSRKASQNNCKSTFLTKDIKEENTESWTQNNWNAHHCLGVQRIHFPQETLARTELKNVCTLGFRTLAELASHSNADQQELENIQMELNTTQRFHLTPSCSDNPESQHTVVVSNRTLTNKTKRKTSKSRNEQLLDFFEAFKVKMQQKDLENQHTVQLLLIKHQELGDLKEIMKLNKMETRIITEKLKYVELRNVEMIKKCNFVFEDMKEKMVTSHNEHFAKQLRKLLDKYERLKKHFDSIKDRLCEEHAARKSAEKALKKTQHVAEQLLMNQTFLEEQRDAAKQDQSACQKKIQIMEDKHKKYIKIIQRFKEERSAVKAEYVNVKDQLRISREENQQLIQTLPAKELDKRRAEKLLQQLREELKDSQIQRKSTEDQLDAMKTEVKAVHKTYRMETVQLQEQHHSCMKELKASVTECETLTEAVAGLKKDKQALHDELRCLKKEKEESETACRRDGERMREVVRLLERERKLLLQEMDDLRKDYFSLSDRITQRLGQLGQNDEPMCITDISPDFHMRTFNKDSTTRPITSSNDVIEHIRRKLEEEENIQH